jgi:hypothetical protein
MARHVDNRRAYQWKDMKERNHLEDLSVDGRVIFIWFSKEWDGEAWRRSVSG